MPKAVAIRDLQTVDGRIFVGYTYGTPPLQETATTENQYENADDLKARIVEIENHIGEEGLMLLHLAVTYLQANGTFGNPNQVLNKTLTLDPLAAQPLKIT